MGDDDYDDYSKELNQYKKSKDRGRGEFRPQVVFQVSVSVVFHLCFTYEMATPLLEVASVVMVMNKLWTMLV